MQKRKNKKGYPIWWKGHAKKKKKKEYPIWWEGHATKKKKKKEFPIWWESWSWGFVNWAQTFSIRSLPVGDDDVDVNDGNDDIWKLLTSTLTGCHLSSDLSRWKHLKLNTAVKHFYWTWVHRHIKQWTMNNDCKRVHSENLGGADPWVFQAFSISSI